MAKRPKPHELRDRSTRVKLNLERSDRQKLLLPEPHLFVTEGTKTEPHYLNGMIKQIEKKYGSAVNRQFAIRGEGDNTLNLLSKAEKYEKNGSEFFRHVWIIYDKDDFPADNFDNTVFRCEALNERYSKEGRETTFHAIWSNQCIELWFLLHFIYLDTDILREEYRKRLSQYLKKGYKKNDDEIFSLLYPYMNRAIRNARTLMESYAEEIAPSKKGPCTNMYTLVEELQRYI